MSEADNPALLPRLQILPFAGPVRDFMVLVPLCKKFASFVGPTLQDDYFYNDPLADQIESVPSSNLLDRLDAEWQRGVLPQVFTPKQRR